MKVVVLVVPDMVFVSSACHAGPFPVVYSTTSTGAAAVSPSYASVSLVFDPDVVNIITIELPVFQPGRSTISWMIVLMSGDGYLLSTAHCAVMVHGTKAVVSIRVEMSYAVVVKVGALSMSCPVICTGTSPVHVPTSHSNST